jgi:hypothetical protein
VLLVSAHSPLRPSRQSSSRRTPGPLPRMTGYAPAHPTTHSQLPGLLPATHWDRSAPVPQMQSWHDGAYRRPSPGQACRNLQHRMSRLTSMFDPHSVTDAIPSASVRLSLRPCSSTCHFQPSTTDHFDSRQRNSWPVSCQLHPQSMIPRTLPEPPHSSAAFQNT